MSETGPVPTSSLKRESEEATSPAVGERRKPSYELPPWALVGLGVLGFGINIATVLSAPFPLAVGVVVASVAAGLLVAGAAHLPAYAFVLAPTVGVVAGIGAHVLAPPTADIGTLSQQLERELQAEAVDGRRVVYRRVVQFHGFGRPSYVFVFRDDRLRDRLRTELDAPRSSDEIRIYDVDDGRLHLRFRFRPQAPGTVRQLPEGDYPGFLFRPLTVEDVDRNDKPELLGAFERYTLASGPLPVPVVVLWDEGALKYRISPLVQEAPRLAPPRGGIDRSIQDAYREPTRIEDETSSRVLAGYAVDQFVVTRRHLPPLLGLAYADFPSALGEVMRWQIKGSFLDFQAPVPRVVPCIGWHVFLNTPRLSWTLSGLRAKIAAAAELRCR